MAEEINAGMGMGPEKPKGQIRGIWAVTIIIAVAILVGGGIWYYFYKTTVQDTGNTNTVKLSPSASASASGSVSTSASASPSSSISWKTYTNDSYKYSFEYPADTKPRSGQTNAVLEIENGKIVQFDYGQRSNFDVIVGANSNNVSSIEDFLNNKTAGYTKTKVAGETAYSISGKFGSYREITYFMHNNQIYTVDGSFGGGEDYECGGAINNTPCATPSAKETATQVVYDKLLNSFKFL